MHSLEKTFSLGVMRNVSECTRNQELFILEYRERASLE